MVSAALLGDVPYSATYYAGINPHLAARGLIAETSCPNANIGGVAMTDGLIHFMGIDLFAGMRLTGAGIVVMTAGVAVTLSKVGLYTKGGTLLASSADQGTAWQTIGTYTIPFTAVYVVPATDMYYAAVIAKGGTVPGLLRTGQSMNTAGSVNSGSQPFGMQTGQTDLVTPATIVVGSGSPVAPWIGFY